MGEGWCGYRFRRWEVVGNGSGSYPVFLAILNLRVMPSVFEHTYSKIRFIRHLYGKGVTGCQFSEYQIVNLWGGTVQ